MNQTKQVYENQNLHFIFEILWLVIQRLSWLPQEAESKDFEN